MDNEPYTRLCKTRTVGEPEGTARNFLTGQYLPSRGRDIAGRWMIKGAFDFLIVLVLFVDGVIFVFSSTLIFHHTLRVRA